MDFLYLMSAQQDLATELIVDPLTDHLTDKGTVLGRDLFQD